MSLTDVVSAMGFGMSTVIDDVLAPGENRPERVVLALLVGWLVGSLKLSVRLAASLCLGTGLVVDSSSERRPVRVGYGRSDD